MTNHPQWADWSQHQLETAALKGRIAINAVVYAELSIGFRRIEEVEAVSWSCSLPKSNEIGGWGKQEQSV